MSAPGALNDLVPIPVRKFVEPHAGQRALLAKLKRFNIARCGRRWGKTQIGKRYLWRGKRGLARGLPVGWMAPNYKYLTEPWRDFKLHLAPFIAHKDEVDRRLELTNGGSIEMWTLDSDDPARGRKFAKIVIDEAGMVRKLLEKWQQAIRPTLTDYHGGALFIGTPKGRNDLWQLEQLALKRPEQWAIHHAPTIQNDTIPDIEEEIEEARQDLPGLVFRQEYLADYVDMAGVLVHAEWLQHGQPGFTYPIILGVDLAISTKTTADYTAIAAITRDHLGRIFVLWVRRFRTTFNDTLSQIKKAAETFNPVKIMIESNQFQAAVVQELVRTTTLPVIGVNKDKDKLTSFLPVASKYEHGLMFHDPSLPPEFESELLAFTGGPDDDHDDMVDALTTAYGGLPALGDSVILGPARDTLEGSAGIIVATDVNDWRSELGHNN